jgi:hypothetical protein
LLLLAGYGWIGRRFLTRPLYWERPAPDVSAASHGARPEDGLKPIP